MKPGSLLFPYMTRRGRFFPAPNPGIADKQIVKLKLLAFREVNLVYYPNSCFREFLAQAENVKTYPCARVHHLSKERLFGLANVVDPDYFPIRLDRLDQPLGIYLGNAIKVQGTKTLLIQILDPSGQLIWI